MTVIRCEPPQLLRALQQAAEQHEYATLEITLRPNAGELCDLTLTTEHDTYSATTSHLAAITSFVLNPDEDGYEDWLLAFQPITLRRIGQEAKQSD